MTTPYNPPPTTPLAGFSTAAPVAYDSPEMVEAVNYLAARYGDDYLRNRQAVDATLVNLQKEHFINPKLFADGVLMSALGVESYSAKNPGAFAQAGTPTQPSRGAADDPYVAPQPTGKPTLSAPVDLNRLPANYRDTLRALNVQPSQVDEFLLKTVVASGQEPTLEAARSRWVRNAVRGDVAHSDLKQSESAVFGVDPKSYGIDG